MAQSSNQVRIQLKVLGQTVDVSATAPPNRAPLDELLPLFRTIDEGVIRLSLQQVESAGQKITCCKGCSACCEAQPVPITPPETIALKRLINSFPESRQRLIRERFADRVSKLDQAGMKETFLKRDPNMDAVQARRLAQEYHSLGLVCPFLENGACGIYEHRPFVCRQYLVTSPAELCADPFVNPVEPISIPIRPASSMLYVVEESINVPAHTVPLVLALEYANRYESELNQPVDTARVAQTWLKHLS